MDYPLKKVFMHLYPINVFFTLLKCDQNSGWMGHFLFVDIVMITFKKVPYEEYLKVTSWSKQRERYDDIIQRPPKC